MRLGSWGQRKAGSSLSNQLYAEFCGVPTASKASESDTRFKKIWMSNALVSWFRLHSMVGKLDGLCDGAKDGLSVGTFVGTVVGDTVGATV